MSMMRLYMATDAGSRLVSTPTASFLPQMKYDVTMALPSRLMIQKLRGMVGRPARFVAQACTIHLPANINAPMKPISFHGVTTMPNQTPMTPLMGRSLGSLFADQQARL